MLLAASALPMNPLVLLAMLSAAFIVLATVVSAKKRRDKWSLLPPGPRGLPLIGNLLQLPRKNVPRAFAAMSRQYGPIYYMRVINRHFVVINDLDMARTLFEKRSATYSHRPRLPMAQDVIKRDTMLFMNYGAAFRQSRKLVATFLNARIAAKYWPAQEVESLKFVLGVARAPQDFLSLTRWTATSLVIRLLYGVEVRDKDNTLVRLAEDFARLTTESTQPGRWLVDSFPILAHVPAWLPGAGFKRWAKTAKARMDEFARLPYEMAKQKIANGEITPCWTAEKLLETTEPLTEQDEKEIRHTATSMYSGGSDTTNAMVSTFILLMLHHPEVQKKAQAEVDHVTGGGAWVPGMRERDQFPYLDCVIKELFRYMPVVPLVPHSLHQDDVFEGVLIPRGSWVMANMWAFMHDERTYPDPDAFVPERFEAGEGRVPQDDPLDIVFGFGRRSCPGYLLGLASVYLNVVHLLFAFDIAPAKDAAGNEVLPPIEFTDNHVAHPKPFKCDIRERSAERITLLEHALHSLQ
ncbi:cytochrome P450 [Phanerochaete sordida]|uniref:Cytochrome P450 n=1 Tax=Phanerochaete sordida TaxID=48140 RepID=A0A9P3GAI2_9APHY|nr:cytochrome P450 [Phanerochaete sordida]